MTLNINAIEQLAAWYGNSDTLADVRSKARNVFFGNDEPGSVKYMAGTGDANGRERRFLGWFGFNFRLPDGRHPAEVAADALFVGSELTSALTSIKAAMYVMAVTTMVIPSKAVFLELEDEGFRVESRILSRELHKDDVLCAHIVPVGRSNWLVCPGWLVWPTHFGPGVRSQLKKFQIDPIKVERFLQQRMTTKNEAKVEHPHDKTLEDAVARMTAAATAVSKPELVRSVEEWKTMVLASMKANDVNGFSQKVMGWVGNVPSIDDLNRWNTTPQPDRGGKTADEIFEEQKNQGYNTAR